MKILLSASFEAAAVSAGKSRSARKPSRTRPRFTRAREQSSRCTSCWLLISREKTAIGFLQIDRDVLGDVHRQRGLAHGRPRRDDDHFRAVQAVGHLVEIGEAGGEAGDPACGR